MIRSPWSPAAWTGLVLTVVLIAGCNSTTPPTNLPDARSSPSLATGAPPSVAPTSPVASAPGGIRSSDPGSATDAPSPTELPLPPEQGGPAFTPPPEMEPQDDDICLALVTRAEATDALGTNLGDIVAQAADPAIQLTCRYVVGSGWLLLTVATESVDTAFDTDLAIATGHGQDASAIDGLGDRAFYAAATATAPEQVVFVKGPAIVRLWNQTDRRIGRDAFTALAALADGRIEAEVRPAP